MCLRRLNYDRKELERKREEGQNEIKGQCPGPAGFRVWRGPSAAPELSQKWLAELTVPGTWVG